MKNVAAFKGLLFQQWRLQRVDVTLLTVAAAVVAPLIVWNASSVYADQVAHLLLTDSGPLGVAGSAIAVVLGVLLACRSFAADARGGHAYALSLPVPRARYALLRVATGLTLGLLPAVGFLIGSFLAVESVPPNPLHAYPIGLSVRFYLAVAFAMSIAFAVQYGLGRKAVRWLLIFAITVGGAETATALLFHTSLVSPAIEVITTPGSPLRVFVDHWSLFDV